MPGTRKWSDDIIWEAYALAAQGEDDIIIAKSFGANKITFFRWKKKYKALFNALKAARKNTKKTSKGQQMGLMREYVHGRLPDELKPVWNEIMGSIDNNNVLPEKRLNALLGGVKDDTKARQTLWLYIWFECNFNQSEACRQLGVSHNIVNNVWKKDVDFMNLFSEMNRIKGDFFEGALMQGVRTGNPYLIWQANKTFNRDRGYGESLDVKFSGSVEHNHVISIDELDLSLDVRKEVLEAMRKRNKKLEVDNTAMSRN